MDLEKAILETPGLLNRLANISNDPLPDTPALSAKIKLLWQCNLACGFCKRPRPAALISREKTMEILNHLKQRGLRKIHFSGGEPMLHPQIMEILDDAAELELQVNLTSNGVLIDKEIARKIKKSGVHSISISLDGATAKTHDRIRGAKGAFKATIKALGHLCKKSKKRPQVRVNTVLTRANAEELDAIHSLLLSISEKIKWSILPVDTAYDALRVDEATARDIQKRCREWKLLSPPPFAIAGSDESGAEISAMARGEYGVAARRGPICYAPWLTVFVDASGQVYPCCMSRGRIPSFGDINQTRLEDALSGGSAQTAKRSMAAGIAPTICAKCDDFVAENLIIEKLLNGRGAAHGQG